MDVTENQPNGTPTWIDLGVPDVDRAVAFYRDVFGWEFDDADPADPMVYRVARLRGKAVAALAKAGADSSSYWWQVYFATDDCNATARRITEAGGELVVPPDDVPGLGRLAVAKDTVGAQFGLWQGAGMVGCEVVNEPSALLRNDLITPDPEPARAFYTAVFGFTVDGDANQSGLDFTFLRRPDGHEIGGIMGVPPAPSSSWGTLIEVADCDETVAKIRSASGSADEPTTMVYGRIANVRDPFGTEFTVGAREPNTWSER